MRLLSTKIQNYFTRLNNLSSNRIETALYYLTLFQQNFSLRVGVSLQMHEPACYALPTHDHRSNL